jgi:hypothetical protein
MKERSRIFNSVIKKRFYGSYLDRGRQWREYKWLREVSRELNRLSLQEVVTANKLPGYVIIDDREEDRIKAIEDNKKIDRSDIGDTKPKQ